LTEVIDPCSYRPASKKIRKLSVEQTLNEWRNVPDTNRPLTHDSIGQDDPATMLTPFATVCWRRDDAPAVLGDGVSDETLTVFWYLVRGLPVPEPVGAFWPMVRYRLAIDLMALGAFAGNRVARRRDHGVAAETAEPAVEDGGVGRALDESATA
jgi:hypothetical protein